jgi:DNA-binding NarL/FixJ family response regulator
MEPIANWNCTTSGEVPGQVPAQTVRSAPLVPSLMHSVLTGSLPNRLRVAMVDHDQTMHEFVRQTFRAHARKWKLDIYPDPDSAIYAIDGLGVRHSVPDCVASPDLVVMDAPGWPDLTSLASVRKLIAHLEQPRVVVLTSCPDGDAIIESLATGVLGCLIKPIPPQCLLCAISNAAKGWPTLPRRHVR